MVSLLNWVEQLNSFDAYSLKSFLDAHKQLMKGLVKDAGKFRTQGVGIVKGEQVQHWVGKRVCFHRER